MRKHAALCLILSFLVVPGCGHKETGPELAKVTGIVTLNDQPLENVTITFTPVGKGGSSIATTDKQGKYTLRYSASSYGAIIGEHIVTVNREFGESNEAEFANEEPPEDEEHSEDFDPEDEPADQMDTSRPGADGIALKIPKHYRYVQTSPLKVTVEDRNNNIPIKLEPN